MASVTEAARRRLLRPDNYTPDDFAAIRRILDRQFHPGAAAGVLLRTYSRVLPDLTSKTLYLLLAGFMRRDRDEVTVNQRVLAEMLDRSMRTVQTAVHTLTLGPIPLLQCSPGKPGRASRYRFVRDPHAWAMRRDAQATEARAARHFDVLRLQQEALRAKITGTIDGEECERRQRQTHRRRDYRIPDSIRHSTRNAK